MSNNQLVPINNGIVKGASVKHNLVQKIMNELDNSLPELIPYRKGDKWGFCDRNKKIVIDCVYDKVYDVKRNNLFFEDGVALVANYNTVYEDQFTEYHFFTFSYIDTTGKEINALSTDNWPCEAYYYSNDHFINGFTYAVRGGKGVIIDNKGNEIKGFIYNTNHGHYTWWLDSEIMDIIAGYLSGKIQIFDKYEWRTFLTKKTKDIKLFSGIETANYEQFARWSQMSNQKNINKETKHSNGMRMITNGRLIGYCDMDERKVIDTIYQEAENFKNNIAWVKYGLEEGFIDKKGNQYWEE